MKLLTLLTFALVCTSVRCAQRVLGVRPEKASLYDPTRPFTCLDGSATIPFSQVNDDYCDCRDGSDEPGTSACLNGQFACENIGYIVQMIPSGRVNDGICDCCDGSDETNNSVQCENTCDVLAVKKRENEEKYKQLTEQGLTKRKQMIEEGSLLRKQIEDSIEELRLKRDTLEAERNSYEALKKEAVEKANTAKAAQDLIFEQKAAEQKQIQEAAQAKALFEFLDLSKDGLLSPEELLSHPELDILFDNDGTFSIEESRQLLDENNQVTGEVFAAVYYEKISPHLIKAGEETTAQADYTEEDHGDESEEEVLGEEEEETVEHEEHELNTPTPPVVNKYDDETQRLIDEANSIKEKFNQADRAYQSMDREIKDKEAQLNYDVGATAEFASMIDRCYEFSDREYTYKLCPFNKCSQISKSSNSDTSIGVWASWGPEGADKYKSMVFTNGQGCWNGPQRSTKVLLSCGLENKIVSVSEPNKCEYEMKFETPGVCEQANVGDDEIAHQEL